MRLHDGEPTLAAGMPLPGGGAAGRATAASVAIVALHGRGASADGILSFLAAELADSLDRVALLAPQARHSTWYPQSFLAPFEANQPWLDSALARAGEVVSEVESAGLGAERIVLFGFSQGACLASEFVARNPRRYAALVAATGGRIGPPGTSFAPHPELVRQRPLAGMPVHLSAGDPDPHVPWRRVEESAASLAALGADVSLRREPGFPHAVHPDAVEFLRRQLARLASG